MGKRKLASNDKDRRYLSEVPETVTVPSRGPWWRRWVAISGPGLMAAVGNMDQATGQPIKELTRLTQNTGLKTEYHLGMGDPTSELVRMINDLRHRVHASLFIIPVRKE